MQFGNDQAYPLSERIDDVDKSVGKLQLQHVLDLKYPRFLPLVENGDISMMARLDREGDPRLGYFFGKVWVCCSNLSDWTFEVLSEALFALAGRWSSGSVKQVLKDSFLEKLCLQWENSYLTVEWDTQLRGWVWVESTGHQTRRGFLKAPKDIEHIFGRLLFDPVKKTCQAPLPVCVEGFYR